MKSTTICAVPDCPALAAKGRETCQPHVEAIRVTSQHGAREKPCLECDRKIKKGDWVWRQQRTKTTKAKPGDRYGWAHVQCEPVAPRITRQELRESPKPLWDQAG